MVDAGVASASEIAKNEDAGDLWLQSSDGLLGFPPEILLHILSYLDLPDLALLAQLFPELAPLTSDPVLHLQRLRIVSPSRVNHNLFGRSPQGHALRPTVADLVQRGVMKGLSIERRWRMGAYFYSLSSIIQYENGLALTRRHAAHVLSIQLQRRIKPSRSSTGLPIVEGPNTLRYTTTAYLHGLHSTHVLPYVGSSSPTIARSLLPVMRKLKWCLQRDRLAKVFKSSGILVGVGRWLDEEDATDGADGGLARDEQGIRRRVLLDGEKVRLAVCPDMKKRVGFYERLGEKVKA